MANTFTSPEDGIEDRPALEQNGEPDDIFALIEMAINEIRRNTDDLASGNISVTAWYKVMADIIATYHLAGWYVANEDDPNDEQLAVIVAKVADQLGYLDGFRTALKDETDDVLSMAYRNRAEMYGRAVKIGYWIGQTGGIELPFYPCERSLCGANCNCGWLIDVVEGGYDATWQLGNVDHCATCVERANLKPLRIRDGQYDRKQVTSKMYA